eukprot:CAMPEP_0118666314 /NCGR_PEP_ID=MMETSP0785-20121206/19143_1 /TAXON_ID=91992 /ORGANISM="Bolidomonas pacifica, Strain CCMP 1866" /LENGTH=318 /DNA_ID=CAMNT_0006560605 /DNA_START=384 /DNA_END=1337 /DNA_ORIENTATION=-
MISPSTASSAPSSSAWSLSPSPTPIRGLYIHGSVGCGKTFLTTLLHKSLQSKYGPTNFTQMVHFNEFMLSLHKSVHKLKKSGFKGDPVPKVSDGILKEGRILCFDEFQVTDVADALIIRRVFTHLWDNGATVIATSNRTPDELYKDGLQRELFVPFIEDLKERCEVVDMDSKVDYRGLKVNRGDKWYHDDDKGFEMFFDNIEGEEEKRTLDVQGRELRIERCKGGHALIEFDDFCRKPKGAGDYLALGEEFNTVMIKGVPRLKIEDFNVLRRFIVLIDCLYSSECKLVVASEVQAPKDVFDPGVEEGERDEIFSWDRT